MSKKKPVYDLTRYVVTIRDRDGIACRRVSVFAKSKAAACAIVMDKARVKSARAEVASTRAARYA